MKTVWAFLTAGSMPTTLALAAPDSLTFQKPIRPPGFRQPSWKPLSPSGHHPFTGSAFSTNTARFVCHTLTISLCAWGRLGLPCLSAFTDFGELHVQMRQDDRISSSPSKKAHMSFLCYHFGPVLSGLENYSWIVALLHVVYSPHSGLSAFSSATTLCFVSGNSHSWSFS